MVIWDLASGRQVSKVASVATGYQAAIAMSPDGRIAFDGQVANGQATIHFVAAHTGREINHISIAAANALAFSPDGRFLAFAVPHDPRIQIWDAAGTKLLRNLAGHTNDVAALVFCPDGRLASGSDDRTIRLWDPATGAERFQFRGHGLGIQSLAVSPDGKRLAAGDKTGAIKLWDLTRDPRGVAFRASPINGEYLDHLAFAADSQSLIVVADKGLESMAHNIALWDPVDRAGAEPPLPGAVERRRTLASYVRDQWRRPYAGRRRFGRQAGRQLV